MNRRVGRGRRAAVTAFAALVLPAFSGKLRAAAPTNASSALDYTQYLKLTSVPSVLQGAAVALGDRLQNPGHERITITGTLTDQSGSSPMKIVMQNGGKLHLEFLNSPGAGGPAGPPVIFNGTSASGHDDRITQDRMLESFVDDLADTLLLTASHGIGLRMLGQGFQDSAGARCDLYDAPMQGRIQNQLNSQRYCFDSASQLLRNVQHFDGAIRVETRFSDWQQVNGQTAPGTVARFQNASQVFLFQAESITVSASANDDVFGN